VLLLSQIAACACQPLAASSAATYIVMMHMSNIVLRYDVDFIWSLNPFIPHVRQTWTCRAWNGSSHLVACLRVILVFQTLRRQFTATAVHQPRLHGHEQLQSTNHVQRQFNNHAQQA
jgi:hypothetical protein